MFPTVIVDGRRNGKLFGYLLLAGHLADDK